MKIGTVYRETAQNLLLRTMSPGTTRGILDTHNLDIIEKYVKAKDVVILLTNTMRDTLASVGVYLPTNLSGVMLHATIPNTGIDEIKKQIAAKHLSDTDLGDLAYILLEAVHDYNVQQQTYKFFSPDEVKNQYRFMPVELTGNADRNMDIIEPMLSAFGIHPKTEYIQAAFKKAQSAFLDMHNIHGKVSLEAYINGCNYAALNASIKQNLHFNPFLAERIAGQILQHNPNLF